MPCQIVSQGSSPLTRGKPAGRVTSSCTLGLIPTHAGKTTPRRATRITRRAHPHSRGENRHHASHAITRTGSSPLTRGKLYTCSHPRQCTRLIPTHAGKTLVIGGGAGLPTAHPHSRGENAIRAPNVGLAGGSSPLTRGKLHVTANMLNPSMAHPHSRGENGHRAVAVHRELGSSPLTRGKLGATITDTGEVRLIPTHAGKTHGSTVSAHWRRAHPHSRGENAWEPIVVARRPGSSPLARGKRSGRRYHRCARRLIPTHAGKTANPHQPTGHCPAHPHSRGENHGDISRPRGEPGSSPLTRGKLRARGVIRH